MIVSRLPILVRAYKIALEEAVTATGKDRTARLNKVTRLLTRIRGGAL